MTFLLGYDIGSSAIKASLVDAATGGEVLSAASPRKEMEILAPRPGWAEQDPLLWWEHMKRATAALKAGAPAALEEVAAVGVSYQMHGLVLVDGAGKVLRPAIIWCDSRSVPVGEEAARRIGPALCRERLLNLPGNFTAAKIGWVKKNEPELFRRARKAMLPGDFIAMMLTGEIRTTPSGLSEGILWDFTREEPARFLLDALGIPPELIPETVPTFSVQGDVTRHAAAELGIRAGVKVAYRAGDQPNNAFSLKVLEPGEIAATAGTSGVVYGVSDGLPRDEGSRVNTFLHVNHEPKRPRRGVLLCVNGTGILNSWLRKFTAGPGGGMSYDAMNAEAARAPAGAGGLVVVPYGNGAERTLGNKEIGASLHGLDFNRHGREHVLRAAQEGIAFALHRGLAVMRAMGITAGVVRAGRANMFLSPLFRETFSSLTGAVVELYETDGAQGAARGAGLGAGIYKDSGDAFAGLEAAGLVEPDPALGAVLEEAYGRWSRVLERILAP